MADLVNYIGESGVDIGGLAILDNYDPDAQLVEYVAVGGIDIGGEALEYEVYSHLGVGGFALGGAGGVSENPIIVASGGLLITGSARIQSVEGTVYLPNDRWTTDTSLASGFLYSRLLHQKNRFASRDTVVYIEGTPQEDVVPIVYDIIYDSTSGEARWYVSGTTNYTVLFTLLGIAKVDLTFDSNGRPVVVFEHTGEIWLYYYDDSLPGYTSLLLGDGTQPFVCWDERREEYVGGSDILVVYKRDNSVFMRKSRDTYALEYATSLFNLSSNNFAIEGFGMTDTYRMQIRVRITKVLEA